MFFFFFKQKTAYEISVRDWSSDVCSSDLVRPQRVPPEPAERPERPLRRCHRVPVGLAIRLSERPGTYRRTPGSGDQPHLHAKRPRLLEWHRDPEHHERGCIPLLRNPRLEDQAGRHPGSSQPSVVRGRTVGHLPPGDSMLRTVRDGPRVDDGGPHRSEPRQLPRLVPHGGLARLHHGRLAPLETMAFHDEPQRRRHPVSLHLTLLLRRGGPPRADVPDATRVSVEHLPPTR